jgi:hypothetical protein
MSFEFSTPPPEAAQILHDAVGATVYAPLLTANLAKVDADAPENRADVAAAQNHFSRAHEIYFMRLDDLANGAGLDKAQPRGWRYLKMDDPDLKTSVEVYPLRAGEVGKGFAEITSGPYCQSTLRAIEAASKNSAVQNGRYEPRLLHVPALALMVLWLHKITAPSPENDIFFPLAPIPSILVANKVYSAGELLDILHKVAPTRMPKIPDKLLSPPQTSWVQQLDITGKNPGTCGILLCFMAEEDSCEDLIFFELRLSHLSQLVFFHLF